MVSFNASTFSWKKAQFPFLLLLFQIVMLILFGIFIDYTEEGLPNPITTTTLPINPNITASTQIERTELASYYPLFQDINVMIFIGFGFLMTFLKFYGFNAVSMTMMLAVVVIQWALIVRGFFEHKGSRFGIGITDMINADFQSASILISFGAIIGVASPVQLLIMAIMEIPVNLLNDYIIFHYFKANDLGGSLTLHTFGAYFGLSVSVVLYQKAMTEHVSKEPESSYTSDITSMIGTVFLWLFWPSFNAALSEDDRRYRAIINTYICLCSCAVTVFIVNLGTKPREKFKMVFLQNSTVAGGVAMGTIADFNIKPYGAMIVGIVVACISVFGFSILQHALTKMRVHDTCGINNLHGMPGVLSGIAATIATAIATKEMYGETFEEMFPEVHSNERTIQVQACYQLAALALTMGLAILGGFITGAVMHIPCLDIPPPQLYFNDAENFVVPIDPNPHEKSDRSESTMALKTNF